MISKIDGKHVPRDGKHCENERIMSCHHAKNCPSPEPLMTTMYDRGNGEKYLACFYCYAPVTA